MAGRDIHPKSDGKLNNIHLILLEAGGAWFVLPIPPLFKEKKEHLFAGTCRVWIMESDCLRQRGESAVLIKY